MGDFVVDDIAGKPKTDSRRGLPMTRRDSVSILASAVTRKRRTTVFQVGVQLWHEPRNVDLAVAIAASYRRLTGLWLCGFDITDWGPGRVAEALYGAPQALLCHDGADDPRFLYANRTAQQLWDLTWNEFVGMPSRLSAEADQRQARARMLAQAAQKGYFTGYRGVRINAGGQRFRIFDTTVFNVGIVGVDAQSQVELGQAAVIAGWEPVG